MNQIEIITSIAINLGLTQKKDIELFTLGWVKGFAACAVMPANKP